MFTAKMIATLSAAALIAVSGAASAAEFQSNGKTVAVYHGDLDLSSAAGQKALRQRIAKASKKVCASAHGDRELDQCRTLAKRNVKAPVEAAIARASTSDVYADASTGNRVRMGN